MFDGPGFGARGAPVFRAGPTVGSALAPRLAASLRDRRAIGYPAKRRRTLAVAAAVGLAAQGVGLLAPAGARATDSNFQPTVNGNYSWADPTVWDTNPAIPNAVGDSASFNPSNDGAQTVSLNGSKTVGTLNLGGTPNPLTINAGTGGSLVFDNTAAPAALNLSNGAADVIASAVSLVDPLAVTQNGGGTLALTGVISGAGSLTFGGGGSGLITLSAANTFTGGVTVGSSTVVRGTAAGAFGAGASTLTLAGGAVQLGNDAATNFARNTLVTANSTVVVDRATSAATATTHTLGTLNVGNATLTVTRGANITGTVIGGLTFGATTLSGAATLAPGATTTLTLGAIGETGGPQPLTINGAGNLALSAAGTYTGGTTITAGIVTANNGAAFGTGTVVLDKTGTVAKRVMIAGGQTVANNFELGLVGTGSTIAAVSGTGLIQQTGTGQAKVNGSVTIGAAASAGGTFIGGTAVGNELVLNGPINSTVFGVASHRAGRIIYAGGGTVAGGYPVTDTMIVGATNGVPTGLVPQLGGSGSATLDMASQGANGFDQTLAGLSLGNPTNNYVGTVNLGGHTLTLNGDLNSLSTTATITASHSVNATAGGGISFGATPRNINVPDVAAADDLAFNGAGIFGTGGATKTGNGTLALRNVTVAGPLTVNAGTIAPSTSGSTGTLTTPALTLAAGTTARFDLSGSGASDVINGGTVTSGGATLTVNQVGAPLTPGTTYPLINYTGTSPGTSNFTLVPTLGRLTGTLVDTGTAIAVQVTGTNDTVRWTGANGNTWDVNGTTNWHLVTADADTTFMQGDDVLFDDSGANTTIAGSTTVMPSRVTLANTTAVPYTFNAGFAIGGGAAVVKTGNGTVTFLNTNSYGGPTTLSGGTLVIANTNGIGSGVAGNSLAISGGARLSMTAGMDLGVNRSIAVGAGGGSLSLNAAAAGTVTVSGDLSGAGPLSVHSAAAGGGTFVLTGNNSGYTGAISVDAQSTGLTALRIGTQSAAPGGGSITVNYPAAGATGNATTLDLPGTFVPAGVTLNLTSRSNGAVSQRTQVTTSGIAAINGPVTLAGDNIIQLTANSGVLTVNGNVTAAPGGFTGTLFVRGSASGVINGTINLPNAAFSKTDGSTWTVNSTGNVWASTNVVSASSVKIGANNALCVTAPLSIGQASDGAASQFDLNGFNQEVNGLTWIAGSGSSSRGVTNTVAATPSTLTINTAGTFAFGANTGVTGGFVTGNVAVVKAGTGSQTLGGADTYTGPTTVAGGTLLVTGVHSGAGSYTVGTGGKLGGTGTVTLAASATNQVLVQPGGVLAPGGAAATGILNVLNSTPGAAATAATVSLAGGSTLNVRLNGLTAGTLYDQVNVTGTVSVAGANLATAAGYTPVDGDKFFLVKNDGTDAVNGTFASVDGVALSGPDASGFYSANTALGLVKVTYTADEATGQLTGGNDVALLVSVPEPASAMLAALAGVGLLARRRRRDGGR